MPQIPDHTLLRVIGRGSYGEVWLARNVMGVGRAVKIVRRASFDSDRPYEREFAAVRRYEPASRMADGLVNVLHVGRCDPDGLFYYVMELADDDTGGEADYKPRTLRSVLAGQPRLPLADGMVIAQSLVQALASLHRTGLTHRDIKPSNIIFVNGRAKLADIGLVGDVGESRSFVGTEGYIPPEGPGLPGADLYALGMVLYEMVTGYPPADYPRVPQEWMGQGSGVEMEFIEVVLQATEPQAARRYQSAGELQADLALLESGKSVRRVHQLERRWKAARRIAALAAALLLLLGGGMWLWHQAQLREERTVAAERLAEQARADERSQRFLALRERAARLVRSELAGWRQPALRDIDEAAKLNPNDVELRNTLITALSRVDLTEQARWSQPGGTTAGPVLSDDGALVAVGQDDGSFRILRTADGSEVQHLKHWMLKIQPYYMSGFTAGGRYFGARFSGMRTLRPVVDKEFLYESWTWFRVSDGKVALELPSRFTCDASPARESARIYAADPESNAIITYDLDSWEETARVTVGGPVSAFHVSPDGRLAALQPGDSGFPDELSVVETATGREIARWKGLRYMTGAVAWMNDSRRLVLGGSNSPRGLRLLDTARPGAAPELLVLHSAEVVAVAVSSDDRFVLTSSWDQTSLLTDLVLRRTVSIMPGYGHLGSLTFARDGRWVSRRIVEADRRTELVQYRLDQPLLRLHATTGQVSGVAFSREGKWLASGHDGGLMFTEMSSGRSVPAQGLNNAGLCAFASETACVAAAFDGLHVVTRDAATGTWIAGRALSIAGNNANALTSAGDSGRVIVWGGSGMSYLLEKETLTEFLPGLNITSGGASADGQLLAYSRGKGSHLYLRDASGREIAKLPAGLLPWVNISPDGTRLSANSLHHISCWDTASQKLLWEREKDFPFIRGSPLHTPDGRYIIARPGLHPALFDAQTGELRAQLAPAFPAQTTTSALDSSGSLLALAARGFVMVWDLAAITAELRARGMW